MYNTHYRNTSNGNNISSKDDGSTKGPLFDDFCDLCQRLGGTKVRKEIVAQIQHFIQEHTMNGTETARLFRMLLPKVFKRTYHMGDKGINSTFEDFFDPSEADKNTSQGDRILSLMDVDNVLKSLEGVRTTQPRIEILNDKKITQQMSGREVAYFLRLLKANLKTGVGLTTVFQAHHDPLRRYETNPLAALRALEDSKHCLVDTHGNKKAADGTISSESSPKDSRRSKPCSETSLADAFQPMLAKPVRNFDDALALSSELQLEIKYDGERVQLHKQGDHVRYYSRSLKPVSLYKIEEFAEYLPIAFPGVDDIILDAEVVLIDRETGTPLPFGNLSARKRKQYPNSHPCLFIFDILRYNGDLLLSRSLVERRKLLENTIQDDCSHIRLSEAVICTGDKSVLEGFMNRVLDEGLEGMMVKDLKGLYEPGKRRWLKMKREYLGDGSMADSADLVVLGAYYGTGANVDKMSVFLMGCKDPVTDTWRTVCKIGNGHTAADLDDLNESLNVTNINKNREELPEWLVVENNRLLPDFVVANPEEAPVWEIRGGSFSKSKIHSADGISIRFPRYVRTRSDKSVGEATTLEELKQLVASS